MSKLSDVRLELKNKSSNEKAEKCERFFKTGKGQYGHGDKFLGITVPECRKIAKKFTDLSLEEVEKLLSSKFHEERLIALLILVGRFESAAKIKDRPERKKATKEIFDFYVTHTRHVNNWDLVDLSAHKIAGTYLLDKKITLLILFAKSNRLWERRIAIISTMAFIIKGDEKPTFLVADLLLDDREDLIQKATGWMLREVGKRISEEKLEEYLKARYKKMGRTALRYAIERFLGNKRQKYLSGKI